MVGYSFTVWNEEGMRATNLTNLTKEEEMQESVRDDRKAGKLSGNPG